MEPVETLLLRGKKRKEGKDAWEIQREEPQEKVLLGGGVSAGQALGRCPNVCEPVVAGRRVPAPSQGQGAWMPRGEEFRSERQLRQKMKPICE